jgi:hypothetical protein
MCTARCVRSRTGLDELFGSRFFASSRPNTWIRFVRAEYAYDAVR